jgi:hypothetical protein
MLAFLLRLSGLDQTLAAFKLRLEEKANEAVEHGKGVVLRISVVAALAVAAAVFALLARQEAQHAGLRRYSAQLSISITNPWKRNELIQAGL